jgi:glycosyltransferase involved in cell wall biosynthesis
MSSVAALVPGSSSDGGRRPRAVLAYHFYAPDPVVSGQVFAGLAEDLALRGFDVEVWPSNRARGEPRVAHRGRESLRGVRVRRVWRPPLSQDAATGRLLNAAWMLVAWTLRCLASRRVDLVVVGSDPPLAFLVARIWRWFRPRTRTAFWCFDVYPDAAVAEGMLREDGPAARTLRRIARWGLRAFHAIADLGPRMRERLATGDAAVLRETLVPWSLAAEEAPEAEVAVARREAFGGARIALLYAGNLGRAHDATAFLDLAREGRADGVVVAFQAIGRREAEVRAAARDLENVRFLPPCDPRVLARRLRAADAHLVSLRPEWSGVVVPSKFFAALAAGRPVLYAGPPDSDVARWIREHDVGAVLPDGLARRAALDRLANDPGWGDRCAAASRRHFARSAVLEGWSDLLGRLTRA